MRFLLLLVVEVFKRSSTFVMPRNQILMHVNVVKIGARFGSQSSDANKMIQQREHITSYFTL